jgi:hypothetical protein
MKARRGQLLPVRDGNDVSRSEKMKRERRRRTQGEVHYHQEMLGDFLGSAEEQPAVMHRCLRC